MKERKKYTREFKVEAVRQSLQEGRSGASLAKELGVTRNMLYRWRKEFLADNQESFPGNGKLKASDEVVARLQREVTVLREERDILKKALVFFSKESR